MAHGQPDFGLYTPKKTVHNLADIAELAARLGSIVTYDRRGDLVWFDNFEDGIQKWRWSDLQLGGAVALSNAAARNGGYSAKMTTPATALQTISMIRYLPYPVLGKFGYEVSFTKDDDHNYLNFISYLYNGVNYKKAGIQVDIANSRLEYLDDANAFQSFVTSITLYESIYLFYTVKLVVDWENSKYVRAIFANTEYDLSAYSIYTLANTEAPKVTIQITQAPTVDSAISGYVDDVIVTQNEP